MNTAQAVAELWQSRAHHRGTINLQRTASKNWNEAICRRGKHTQVNLMQQVYAPDEELTMTGKSMTGEA